jgi:hypothetical protein
MLTDEVFDLRDEAGKLEKHVKNAQGAQEDEAEVVQAINELAERVDQVSARIKSA